MSEVSVLLANEGGEVDPEREDLVRVGLDVDADRELGLRVPRLVNPRRVDALEHLFLPRVRRVQREPVYLTHSHTRSTSKSHQLRFYIYFTLTFISLKSFQLKLKSQQFSQQAGHILLKRNNDNYLGRYRDTDGKNTYIIVI